MCHGPYSPTLPSTSIYQHNLRLTGKLKRHVHASSGYKYSQSSRWYFQHGITVPQESKRRSLLGNTFEEVKVSDNVKYHG